MDFDALWKSGTTVSVRDGLQPGTQNYAVSEIRTNCMKQNSMIELRN